MSAHESSQGELGHGAADPVSAALTAKGIYPTAQRLEIARVMLSRCQHLSAEDIFARVNEQGPRVSKATVYNTLKLFAEKGLVREVIVDPTKIFYDSNIFPHHHVYNVSTGELVDIEDHHLRVVGLPPLPAGTAVDGMDVIVRVRRTS